MSLWPGPVSPVLATLPRLAQEVSLLPFVLLQRHWHSLPAWLHRLQSVLSSPECVMEELGLKAK